MLILVKEIFETAMIFTKFGIRHRVGITVCWKIAEVLRRVTIDIYPLHCPHCYRSSRKLKHLSYSALSKSIINGTCCQYVKASTLKSSGILVKVYSWLSPSFSSIFSILSLVASWHLRLFEESPLRFFFSSSPSNTYLHCTFDRWIKMNSILVLICVRITVMLSSSPPSSALLFVQLRTGFFDEKTPSVYWNRTCFVMDSWRFFISTYLLYQVGFLTS